jgi:hypothetical protein
MNLSGDPVLTTRNGEKSVVWKHTRTPWFSRKLSMTWRCSGAIRIKGVVDFCFESIIILQ